jgi:hypothetical protein
VLRGVHAAIPLNMTDFTRRIRIMDALERLTLDLEDAIIAEPAQYVTSAWLERVAKRLLEAGWTTKSVDSP